MKEHSGGTVWGFALFSKLATLAMIALGALVLAGWVSNERPLIQIIPTVVAMNPVTAAAFILAGSCLWRLTGRVRRPQSRPDAWAIFLAAVVALLGLFRLVDHVLPLGFHVDRLIFPSKLQGWGIFPPVRWPPTPR